MDRITGLSSLMVILQYKALAGTCKSKTADAAKSVHFDKKQRSGIVDPAGLLFR